MLEPAGRVNKKKLHRYHAIASVRITKIIILLFKSKSIRAFHSLEKLGKTEYLIWNQNTFHRLRYEIIKRSCFYRIVPKIRFLKFNCKVEGTKVPLKNSEETAKSELYLASDSPLYFTLKRFGETLNSSSPLLW